MIDQIKKELAATNFAPVKHRFIDGQICIYFVTMKVFDAIPGEVKQALTNAAEKCGGYADTHLGCIKINPLRLSWDCKLTVKQYLTFDLQSVYEYLTKFYPVKSPYEGTTYVEYKGWAFYKEYWNRENPVYGASKINEQ